MHAEEEPCLAQVGNRLGMHVSIVSFMLAASNRDELRFTGDLRWLAWFRLE